MLRNRKILWLVAALLLLVVVDLLLLYWWNHRAEVRYDTHIKAAAARYDLDPALIKAVIWQESRFNAGARGRAGEIGLMQIREDAAFEWADAEKIHPFEHRQILDPAKNIQAGTFYLAKLLKRYQQTDNPIPYALADYNAGRGNVLRWLKADAKTNSTAFLARMDFPGTRDYATKILHRHAYYRERFRR